MPQLLKIMSVLGILFLIILVALQPRNDNVPSIYYYSYDSSAFIIEKADGRARRILAEYEHVTGGIAGPGWSPSGRWFAWDLHLTSYIPDETAFVVKRNGGTPISLRQYSQGVEALSLSWSPVADILLVHDLYTPPQNADRQYFQFLYYPETRDVQYLNVENTLRWLPDGRLFTIDAENTTITFVSLTGEIEANPIFAEKCEFVPYGVTIGQQTLTYKTDNRILVVENFVQDQHYEFQVEGIVFDIDWNRSETQGLVYLTHECYGSRSLWLIDLEKGMLNLELIQTLG